MIASSCAQTRGERTHAGGLDAAMAEAAIMTSGPWLPLRGALEVVARAMRDPGRMVGGAGRLGRSLGDVVRGTSTVAVARDRRFRDEAWTGNPLLHRVAQAYLLLSEALDQVVLDADLDWQTERRLRLLVANAVDALAPTNLPVTNPEVIKATLDSGGRNFVRGARHAASDVGLPSRTVHLPRMVDRDSFVIGETLAATPGTVVHRSPQFELLRFDPVTPRVHDVPLLLVPSVINKYYVVDLSPGRSLVEHLTRAEHEVYVMSWRNPGPAQAEWDLETYARAVLDALDVVGARTGVIAAHCVGLCAGGIILAIAAAHLAATERADRLASLSLVVNVLDQHQAGDVGALLDEETVSLALAASSRAGYLKGQALAGVFAWLRPHERIWRFWVDQYLLGRERTAFDILYWNEDTTNLTAAMHRDLLDLGLHNRLVSPGGLESLGTPLDLGALDVDAYIVAGATDHITPWESSYRTTQLLGGRSRFVLARAGHVATVVSPPGRAGGYWTADKTPSAPETWLDEARFIEASWWEDWAAWLAERSAGKRRPAARRPRRAAGRAPGEYVSE